MTISAPTHPLDPRTRRRLLEAVAARLDRLDADEVVDAQLEELADRMVASIPQRSPWDEILGPFYTTQRIQQLLGITRQAVTKRVQSGSLVRVMTSEGTALFPVFQIQGGRPLAGLREVVTQLRQGTDDDYAIAQWLVTPDPRTGLSPSMRLANGEDRSVAAQAADTAAAWAA